MTNLYDIFKEKVLKKCQKPARYIGLEINSVKKDWDNIKVRWALLFPDLYEIGASNLGIAILYDIINRNNLSLCERFFFPDEDAIKIMEQEKIPPLSLESKKEARSFHILGITLPYDLTLTNILKFFDLSQIKIYAKEREQLPIVIGGGALAFNPLPFQDFFDLFVIGDGEEAVTELTELLLETNFNKKDFLIKASKLEGIYVPSIHDKDNVKIKKRIVYDLNKHQLSSPLVPVTETTFNRLSIEISRGCLRGCRFCFAGFAQRPYRERDLKNIYENFYYGIENTGFDEFSPSSLSTTDYSLFSDLFHCLYHLSIEKKASISLPSLRVGSIKSEIAEKVKEFRKTGFTVAPESFPSMQKKINKNIDFSKLEEDILNALNEGWLNIKLYFMIGLPDEDFNEIYELKKFLKEIINKSKNKKANITLSFSSFVPKPHTPLQWERMNSLNELMEKQNILKKLFYREKKIFLKLHNPYMSIVEGIISRGDERLNKVIEKAYKNGAILDAWDEKFNFSKWNDAFLDFELDYNLFLHERSIDEKLPWDFIDTGVTKEFLLEELKRFKKSEITEDCRYANCNSCGVCDFKKIKNVFSKKEELILSIPKKSSYNPRNYLIIYTKKEDSIFLSNLDLMRFWHRILRMANIELSYTKGFNPQPRIDSGWALPLGIESNCEVLKIQTETPINNLNIEKIKSKLIDGIRLIDIIEFESKKPLESLINMAEFYCKKPYLFDTDDKIVIKRKDKEKIFSIADFVSDLEKSEKNFRFKIKLVPGGLKPIEYVNVVAGDYVKNFDLIKEKVLIEEIGWIGKRVDD